jgi:hypothetical protein
MLTNRTLARINNRPREVGRMPLLAAGGGALVLAALIYAFAILPPPFVLAVLGGGSLLVFLLYATQKSKTTIKLTYEGKLDEEAALRFSGVQDALEGLASSEGIWCLPAAPERPKAGEARPTPERDAARVGLLSTPGIRADVPVWGIEAGDESIFFFPEGALTYADDRYAPLPYNSLKVAFSSGRFFEEEDLPNDATVVGRTWRFSRPDGSPDPRYKKDNVEIPVVLYGLLDLSGPSGLGTRLMVSNRREAASFARAFGARNLREKRRGDGPAGKAAPKERNGREEEPKSSEELEREARLAGARKTLGVAEGASAKEIGAAYRKLALIHHPDKVANLEPDARDYSERRMKAVNAAYAEFKRQWNDSATEGARVG